MSLKKPIYLKKTIDFTDVLSTWGTVYDLRKLKKTNDQGLNEDW